jgi:Zn-dependent protease
VIPAFDVRIAGFPVRIELTFFLTAAILGQGRPDRFLLTWIAVVFVSVLLHELGHAAAFRVFGDSPRITLHAFGGVTRATKALPLGQDLVATVAGSLTGLVLLGLPALALRSSLYRSDVDFLTWYIVLSDLAWANIGWSVLNLLPVLPLDGGLVARRILTHVLGPRGGTAALIVSTLVAGAGATIAFTAGELYLGFFALFFLARDSAHVYRGRDDRRRERIQEARALGAAGDRRRAEEVLREIAASARTIDVKGMATRELAWLLIEDGHRSEARSVMAGLPLEGEDARLLEGSLQLVDGPVADGARTVADWWLAHLALRDVLVGQLARSGMLPAFVDRILVAEGEDPVVLAAHLQYTLHESERYEEAAEVGRRLFDGRRGQPALAAYIVACSLTRDGHLGQALDWLDRAVQSGWQDGPVMDRDDDLAPLRSLP